MSQAATDAGAEFRTLAYVDDQWVRAEFDAMVAANRDPTPCWRPVAAPGLTATTHGSSAEITCAARGRCPPTRASMAQAAITFVTPGRTRVERQVMPIADALETLGGPHVELHSRVRPAEFFPDKARRKGTK